jgi:hypothetical protein
VLESGTWDSSAAFHVTAILSRDRPAATTSIVVGIGIGVAVAVIGAAAVVVVFVRYRLAGRETTKSEGPTDASAAEFAHMTYTNIMDLVFDDDAPADSLYMDVVKEKLKLNSPSHFYFLMPS